MIDWEDLAQGQIAEIQRALPESIRARAIEVPVFLSRAGNRKSGACLGVFEGCSLLDGPPTQPDEMPRITLFFDTLARAAKHRRKCVFPPSSNYLPSRIGTLLRVGRRTDHERRPRVRRGPSRVGAPRPDAIAFSLPFRPPTLHLARLDKWAASGSNPNWEFCSLDALYVPMNTMT